MKLDRLVVTALFDFLFALWQEDLLLGTTLVRNYYSRQMLQFPFF